MAFVAIYALHGLIHGAGVKVVLSGEGADEVFMGYDLFAEVYIKEQIRQGRSFDDLRSDIESVNAFMPNDPKYHQMLQLKFSNFRALAEQNGWNASHTQSANLAARTIQLFRHGPDVASQVDDGWQTYLTAKYPSFQEADHYRRAQIIEAETLLSGHLLSTQGDRVSMAHSVETRMPFLDSALVAFSIAQDAEAAFLSRGSEKAILKDAYRGRVPEQILSRKKFPFRAPDSLSVLSSSEGREFLLDHIPVLEDLEHIFDQKKTTAFFVKCASNGTQSPRDNLAFVLSLTTVALQVAMRRRVQRTQPRASRVVARTRFGDICRIVDWN
jgi:asparagine synthase (glutamine-hydrolysing)